MEQTKKKRILITQTKTLQPPNHSFNSSTAYPKPQARLMRVVVVGLNYDQIKPPHKQLSLAKFDEGIPRPNLYINLKMIKKIHILKNDFFNEGYITKASKFSLGKKKKKKEKKKWVPNTTTKSKCKSANRTKQKFLHTSLDFTLVLFTFHSSSSLLSLFVSVCVCVCVSLSLSLSFCV
jgi:hypothetical protein